MLAADLINQEFFAESITPQQLDLLLADGWRHFGTHFFRYNFGVHEFEIRAVIPLRIRLADFRFSKSQRRVIRKNADLKLEILPVHITPEKELLFDRHKLRFKFGIPDSIYDFISVDPPCETFEINASLNDRVIAASFLDIGADSVSSVYAMFEPAEASRSAGTGQKSKGIGLRGEARSPLPRRGLHLRSDGAEGALHRGRAWY